MMLDSISTILTLTLFASLGFTNAQMVGEIGDGQIQNQASTAAPSVAPPATTRAAIESAANSTLPPPYAPKQISASLPGPRVPLYTANMSVSALATGTGVAGGNASAPTVPAVPTVVGAAPSEGGGPREAGTSAPVVVGNGAQKGRVGMGMGLMVVGWGVLVAMMG